MATIDDSSSDQVGWAELDDMYNSNFPYAIKADDYDIDPRTPKERVNARGPPFRLAMCWKPFSEGNTTEHFRMVTKITWYKFAKAPSSARYDWELTFVCTDTYFYGFTDGTENDYSIDVLSNGTHHVRFNSSNPTIKEISGEKAGTG